MPKNFFDDEEIRKERNKALFSLDRKVIELYLTKYGMRALALMDDDNFWCSVYSSICAIKDAPEAIRAKAAKWLFDNCYPIPMPRY